MYERNCRGSQQIDFFMCVYYWGSNPAVCNFKDLAYTATAFSYNFLTYYRIQYIIFSCARAFTTLDLVFIGSQFHAIISKHLFALKARPYCCFQVFVVCLCPLGQQHV